MTTPATLVLLRLDEPSTDVAPSDKIGSLYDLQIDTGLTLPPVVAACMGFGRQFSVGAALDAVDVVPGSSLTTRDVTVQAILSWDIFNQNVAGTTGTIVARGKGSSSAEYVSYGVELRVVNASLSIGEIRFFWQDTAGTVHTELGGQFIVPPLGSYIMLTAVRHWVNSTDVELRYYVGCLLIGEFLTTDGDIGGGTTGTFCLGTRYTAGAPGNFLVGTIDELRVLNYELTAEEIGATWDRLSRLQPRGYRAIKDLLPPGAPISDDPASRIQKLFRIIGHAIGYAAAQVENVRNNLPPDRAYGPALAQWEGIVGEAPKAPDTVITRRRRVVGHLRQHAGTSVPGVQAATADLLQLAASQVQVLAFDNTIREDWSLGLRAERWWADPTAKWSIAAAALRVQALISDNILFDGTTRQWSTCFTSAPGTRRSFTGQVLDGLQANLFAKIVPATLPDKAEAGIAFYDWAAGNALLFGLRNNAGTYELVTESFKAWVSQGVTVQAVSALVTQWLNLVQLPPGGILPANMSHYAAAWSTTSQLAGYTTSAPITHPTVFQYAGIYLRGFNAALAGAVDVSFDDIILRTPFGPRPFRWYVYRDPTLPGTADFVAAHAAIQRIKHAHTAATVITSKSLLADSSSSGADRGPCGAL